jgi:prepilin-type N-terminal cleavage/methylation domain-containing protein
MRPVRNRHAGYTITEVMIVVAIISILAAVATPSFTKDSAARQGRAFGSSLAQSLQRARFEAMAKRVPYRARICLGRVEILEVTDPNDETACAVVRRLFAPPSVGVWRVGRGSVGPPNTPDADMTSCRRIQFTTLGAAIDPANPGALEPWRVFIRNERLRPLHPDGGYRIAINVMTGFTTMRDVGFPQ